MPLVFVHGVNVRRGTTPEAQKAFDNKVAMVEEQFRVTAFSNRVTAPDGLRVFSPYWGDLGVTFARNLKCVPHGALQSLAVGTTTESQALLQATAAQLDTDALQQPGLITAPLVTIAKTRNLSAALDMLFAGANNAPLPSVVFNDARKERARPQVADFADAAVRYAESNPDLAWLAGVNDDPTFITKLLEQVGAYSAAASGSPAGSPAATAAQGTASAPVQTLSIGGDVKDWFTNAATAVKGAVTKVKTSVTGAAMSVATTGTRDAFLALFTNYRPAASTLLARFFGDVFSYMENRQPVLDRLLPVIDAAAAARREGDSELYLVGHSFGGILLYEILTEHRPDIACDLYMTVGSQVALFAELDRIEDKQPIRAAFAAGPDTVVPRPAAAKRWINVLDETDLFGFGTTDVFSGSWDCKFDTQAMPLVSHGAYFDTPRFYARVRERVRDAFENGTDAPYAGQS